MRTGVEVVLHGTKDAARLREAGFDYNVEIARPGRAGARRTLRRTAKYAAAVAQSPLPSGRTSYRDLADYNTEMTQLARRYKNLVKPLTLKNRSIEGRHGPRHRDHHQRRPTSTTASRSSCMLGAHHAREWPSAEHAMEFAYDLLENYRTDARARRSRARTPGRSSSRWSTSTASRSRARRRDRWATSATFDYEMKRKNCSISTQTPDAVQGRDLRRQPGRPAARHRPEPQLPRLLGWRWRQPDLVQRHLPR